MLRANGLEENFCGGGRVKTNYVAVCTSCHIVNVMSIHLISSLRSWGDGFVADGHLSVTSNGIESGAQREVMRSHS